LESLQSILEQAKSEFGKLNEKNDKWLEAINLFMDQTKDDASYSLLDCHNNVHKLESMGQYIMKDIEKHKKENCSNIWKATVEGQRP
jgi:hypothetical protein